jgi:hypothetical protein
MDYSNLPLTELKKLAKGRRIKMYYTKSIRELRWILAQTDLPMKYKVEKFTIKELRDQAKEKNIRGFWNLSRGQLQSLLYPNYGAGTEEHDKYDHNANEHGSPKSSDSNQVRV